MRISQKASVVKRVEKIKGEGLSSIRKVED